MPFLLKRSKITKRRVKFVVYFTEDLLFFAILSVFLSLSPWRTWWVSNRRQFVVRLIRQDYCNHFIRRLNQPTFFLSMRYIMVFIKGISISLNLFIMHLLKKCLSRHAKDWWSWILSLLKPFVMHLLLKCSLRKAWSTFLGLSSVFLSNISQLETF